MKYVLIGHYANDQLHSMELFDRLIKSHLEELEHVVQIWKPSVVFGSILKSAHGLGKWLGYLDKFLIFPFVLFFKLTKLQRNVLIIIPDHSHGIYVPLFLNRPHVIHVHDLIAIKSALGEFQQLEIGRFGKIYQSRILKGLVRGKHFICISNTTQDELLKIAKDAIHPSQSQVVLNELNYDYQRVDASLSVTRLENLMPNPSVSFLLHVGNGAWYKNRDGVIRVFAEWKKLHPDGNEKLIVVGEPPNSEILELVRELNLSEFITFLNQISHDQLEALYSMAKAFLFPSFHEGFGWPIIEAFACGCPVITTDKAPMSEIAGNQALLLPTMPDPTTSEHRGWLELGTKLIDASLEESHQMKTQERIAHAQHFKPGSAFPKYLKIYSDILRIEHG